jgi:hypothetical protein
MTTRQLWLGNRQSATNLARKLVRNFLMSGDGFNMARLWIAPELVLFTLTFQETSIPAQVSK